MDYLTVDFVKLASRNPDVPTYVFECVSKDIDCFNTQFSANRDVSVLFELFRHLLILRSHQNGKYDKIFSQVLAIVLSDPKIATLLISCEKHEFLSQMNDNFIRILKEQPIEMEKISPNLKLEIEELVAHNTSLLSKM
jgi:hypothetical protein